VRPGVTLIRDARHCAEADTCDEHMSDWSSIGPQQVLRTTENGDRQRAALRGESAGQQACSGGAARSGNSRRDFYMYYDI
jgi:hypothetical protein